MANSGRILLRTSKELHQRLIATAESRTQSLNDLCVERLSVPSSLEGEANLLLRNVLASAEELLGPQLKGLILYGSRARGDAYKTSDWDFLIVTSPDLLLTRRLYHRWDAVVPEAAALRLEVNFAQMPLTTHAATGFWSEIALDGIVLYEKHFTLSQHLARLRKDIAAGLIVRRIIHGQAYWVYEGAA